MKKCLFILAALFAVITMNAQGNSGASSGTVIYENDYTGITEFTGWYQFDDSQTDGNVEVDPDGIAIYVGIQTGEVWQPQVLVVPDGSFDLMEGGSYKVVITAKFPSNGTLQINMGTWSANDQAEFPIEATGDFQEVECDFEDWSVDADGAHLLFQCGDFQGTTILKSIKIIDLSGTVPSTRTTIDNITYKINRDDNTAVIVGYTPGIGEIANIPETIYNEGVGYSVVKIGEGAFSVCNNLRTVIIPNSVKSIGNNAFSNCENLTFVLIPSSVETIGSWAFHYCRKLTSLTLSNGLVTINTYAFNYCSGLTSITIPASVESIGESAFYGCSNLGSISVETGNPIYDSRNNCNAIIKTESNTLITGCKNTIIPNDVTSIGGYAFSGCSNLTSITIPTSVTSIEEFAFQYCSGLTSITIPNSVTSIKYGAFAYCSNLESISVETGNPNYDSRNNCNAIIEIKSNTLIAGCKNTIIPNDVTSIGSHAFSGRYNMTSIDIPTAVTSIGSYAFEDCGLTSITIPNSVTIIGSEAFFGCNNLTSITIPNSVTTIEEYAFESCNSLATVVSEINNPFEIYENVFYNYERDIYSTVALIVPVGKRSAYQNTGGWKKFQTIMEVGEEGIPGQVFVYDKVFYKIGENSIVSVTSGNGSYSGDIVIHSQASFNGYTYSVTSIEDNAFKDCYSLTSITIPNSVTSIGESAFYGCNLNSIVSEIEEPFAINENVFGLPYEDIFATASLLVPAGTKSAYQTTEGWNQFNIIVEPGEGGAVGQKFESGGLYYIIGENNTAKVTYGNNSYSGDVVIPSQVAYNGVTYSVTGIGEYAFSYCRDLASVVIPNSVTTIEDWAFQNSISLTSITIPSGVTSIGWGAFSSCSGLTSIVVENGNTVYDSRNNCNAIIHSETNKLIAGCKNTVIPTSVSWIGYRAFAGCTGLTSITIQNNITSIDTEAFANCSNLASIVVEEGNPEFDSSNNSNAIIYSETKELVVGCKNTIIPSDVMGIRAGAFLGCSGLTSIEIPEGVTDIGWEAFRECSSLKSIVIPEGVTIIEGSTFEGCTSLASVDIPDGVTNIGGWAFGECRSLKSIVIPSTVTDIDVYAFAYCEALKEVHSMAEAVPTAYESVFYDVNIGKATLYVPSISKAAYSGATPWSSFGTILGSSGKGDVNCDGHINQEDSEAVANYIMGNTPTVFNVVAADTNGDKKVNAADIVFIVKWSERK